MPTLFRNRGIEDITLPPPYRGIVPPNGVAYLYDDPPQVQTYLSGSSSGKLPFEASLQQVPLAAVVADSASGLLFPYDPQRGALSYVQPDGTFQCAGLFSDAVAHNLEAQNSQIGGVGAGEAAQNQLLWTLQDGAVTLLICMLGALRTDKGAGGSIELRASYRRSGATVTLDGSVVTLGALGGGYTATLVINGVGVSCQVTGAGTDQVQWYGRGEVFVTSLPAYSAALAYNTRDKVAAYGSIWRALGPVRPLVAPPAAPWQLDTQGVFPLALS